MSNPTDQRTPITQLLDDGFLVFDRVLSQDMLDRLRAATDRILDAYSDEQREKSGNQGQIVAMAYQDPVFQELIAWRGSLEALRHLGFDDPRYWSAFIISKEPHTPQAYWHQDWPFWDDPVSYDPLPHQPFLMFYLTDTSPENGCLRVIPQSHRQAHQLHATGGHDGDIRHQDPATSSAYSDDPEQVDVSVRAGDLVLGDARLLHVTNANQTNRRRTVITMWYLPRYRALTEPLRAAFQERLMVLPPEDLPPEEYAMIEPLLPAYEGQVEPRAWNRKPDRFIDN